MEDLLYSTEEANLHLFVANGTIKLIVLNIFAFYYCQLQYLQKVQKLDGISEAMFSAVRLFNGLESLVS